MTRRRPKAVPLGRQHLDASSPPTPDTMLDEIGVTIVSGRGDAPGAAQAVVKRLAALLMTPPKGSR